MALFRYPSKTIMSLLAGMGLANLARTSAAGTVNGPGTLFLDGTTAREIKLGTCEKGDFRMIQAVGETAAGAFTVVPDDDPAVTIKQLDGTTAAATTSLADAGDWVIFVGTGHNTWQVFLHSGCTFA